MDRESKKMNPLLLFAGIIGGLMIFTGGVNFLKQEITVRLLKNKKNFKILF